MATVKLYLDVKDDAYVIANPDKILGLDEPIYKDNGTIAFGDGVTVLSALVFKPLFVTVSQILTGGIISVGTYGGSGLLNDIRVTASTFYIIGSGYHSAIQTDFLDIALSSSGTQRYIGLYGTTLDTITKVEGTEAALATFPTQPANTVLIGYVLVTDAAASSTPDLSGYLLRSDKATAAEVLAGTNDTNYITPLSLATGGLNLYIYFGGHAGLNYPDSVNLHMGWNNLLNASQTDTQRRTRFLQNGTIKAFDITFHVSAVIASGETIAVYLRNITDGVDTFLKNVTLNGAASTFNIFVATGLNIPVVTSKDYTIKMVVPAFATNPTGVSCSFNFLIQ